MHVYTASPLRELSVDRGACSSSPMSASCAAKGMRKTMKTKELYVIAGSKIQTVGGAF